MPTNMDHWNGYHMLHHINNNQRADQIRGIRGKSRLLQTPGRDWHHDAFLHMRASLLAAQFIGYKMVL